MSSLFSYTPQISSSCLPLHIALPHLCLYVFWCVFFFFVLGKRTHFSQHAVAACVSGCKQGVEEQWLLRTCLAELQWQEQWLI